MSSSSLRTLAFGDLDASVWGIAWIPDPRQPGFLGLGTVSNAASVSATVDAEGENGNWSVQGEGVQLTASPADAAASSSSGDGFDQLCRVQGRIAVAGAELAVDCLGLRALHAEAGDLDRFESIRDVSGWFDASHGLTLVALRPHKSRGQESDVVTALVLDPEASLPVSDPRLSTTYGADGLALRVGLELWLDGDDDDEEEQYPRRATGDTVGAAAAGHVGRFDVRAQFVRWHGRDGDGAGVYLLAQHA